MPISIDNTTLTFNNGTTMTTAATGTVSSVATGNGLSGGTITTTGTLIIACPTFGTVGAYCVGFGSFTPISKGGNYSAGINTNQVRAWIITNDPCTGPTDTSLSGTWKHMGASWSSSNITSLFCRVS